MSVPIVNIIINVIIEIYKHYVAMKVFVCKVGLKLNIVVLGIWCQHHIFKDQLEHDGFKLFAYLLHDVVFNHIICWLPHYIFGKCYAQ